MKIYQIRINLKSKVEGVKLKPSHMTGVVIANSQKEAENFVLLDFQKWLDERGYKAYPQIGSVKTIPSKFVLNATKK
ncbi:hypothetical protein AB4865_07740 [Capnocytophaga sp. ARDL2]|uniref:hypothetical protein n=1 Tax=Capnocytophaga sp. ARDL2 TaxID=3238809 RepID=UPI00355794F9